MTVVMISPTPHPSQWAVRVNHLGTPDTLRDGASTEPTKSISISACLQWKNRTLIAYDTPLTVEETNTMLICHDRREKCILSSLPVPSFSQPRQRSTKKKQVDKIWEADSGGVSSFVSLVSTGPNLRLHQSFVQTQGRLATWTQPKLGGIHPWNLCTWCFPWLNMVSKQVDQTSTNQI